jgi:O-acetylserine/cysteine efflux transporter
MKVGALPGSHALLALVVVAVWGTNFVVIKAALAHFSPLWLAALRFSLAALPLFWLPKPAVSWRLLAAYGLLIGVGQFGALFVAMRDDITPALASLMVQSQVFFTLLLAWALRGQSLKRVQGVALLLACAGVVFIGSQLNAAATPLGVGLVLTAGFCWGSANVVNQLVGKVDMLAFMVWTSAFAAPALGVLALGFEGPQQLVLGAQHAGWGGWLAVVWQALGNTLFGYGVWGWLLARHPAGDVVPMALLVPVIGFSSSAWFLGEALPAWKIQGALLVMAGLLVNAWGTRKRE